MSYQGEIFAIRLCYLVSKDFDGGNEMGDDRGFGRNEVEESILSGNGGE